MPANLPKEARVKYQKVLESKTKEEKLKALQEYLSAIPKHKGTENLVAQVRHQIARLRKEIEKEKELKKKLGSSQGFSIKKEGDLQFILVGFTKSGKSSLISTLTNAKSEYGERPYITTQPLAGTLNYKGVLIQLIDTPSLMEGNEDWNNIVFSLARSSDGIILVLDGSRDLNEQFQRIKEMFREHGILIGEQRFSLRITKSPIKRAKILLYGEVIGATEEMLYKILSDYEIKDLLIEFSGKATLEEFEAALTGNIVSKPAMVIVNKAEFVDPSKVNFENLCYVFVSTKHGIEGEEIGKMLFNISNMIRVYTKEPNEELPSQKPLVVKRGTTVIEIAEIIHRDLAKNFKYARIWGKSVKYPGEKVGPKHVLEDGDVIEIRA